MSSKFKFSGIYDFRTGGRYLTRSLQHPTGVRFDLFVNLTDDDDGLEAYIYDDESASTDHQLKSIEISFHSVSKVNGRHVIGAKIAHSLKTHFNFDGEAEDFDLNQTPKDRSEFFFKLDCVAEVEKMSLQTDLRQKFLKAPDNPDFADTTLECGGEELKCHSVILAARSPVFHTALTQTGFIEAQTRRIKIEDMDLGILRKMIRFFLCYWFYLYPRCACLSPLIILG